MWRLDLAVAVVLAAVAGLEAATLDDPGRGGHTLAAIYGVLTAGSVVVRRTAPIVAVAVAAAAVGVVALIGHIPEILAVGLVQAFVLPYAVAAYLPLRRALACLVVLEAILLLTDLDRSGDYGLVNILIDLAFAAAAAAIGYYVQRSRRQVEVVSQSAADRAADAVVAERARIARELHDIVGHGMSVMIVQADAARHEVPEHDSRTRDSLAMIESVGRESLREMRRLLGLLRDESVGESSLAPQPGIADLAALAAELRTAGLAVELTTAGEPVPISRGLGLTAYRIVQEALTNTLRHAGPARAQVHLRYGTRDVEVVVSDTGRGTPGSSGDGRGILGMRERARIYGGTLSAGPGTHGWEVRAVLPIETSAAP